MWSAIASAFRSLGAASAVADVVTSKLLRRIVLAAMIGVLAIPLLVITTVVSVIGQDRAAAAQQCGIIGADLDFAATDAAFAAVHGSPVGFALVDAGGNVLAEHNPDATGLGRSISKALVLVALTRTAAHRHLTAREQQLAAAMIERSDNPAASELVDELGVDAVDAAAARAGMVDWRTDTSDPVYTLGRSQVSAIDFANLFAQLNTLVPVTHLRWARELLAHIDGPGRYGVLQAGIPGTVLSKGGWEDESGGGWTVNQAAQLRVAGQTYGLAVVLGDQQSFQAGGEAIARVAAAVYAALTAAPQTPATDKTSGGAVGTRGPPAQPGYTIHGPVSTFGPPLEPAGGTAYGRSSADAGLALNPDGGAGWDDALARSLANKWFRLTVAGHSHAEQVIDKGPDAQGRNGWRMIDVTGAAAEQLDIDPASFPTDSIGTAVELAGPPTGTVDASSGAAGAQGADPDTGTAMGSACDSGASTAAAGPLPLTPGTETKILTNGLAAAGEDAPEQVKAMVAAGNAISNQPYVFGGGHGFSLDAISPNHYDCSSAVSYVLHAGGALGPGALDSTGLESWGAPGPGKYVTVYTNSEHAFMYVGGLRFDTSHNGTDTGPNQDQDGPRWRVLDHVPDWAPWVVRHPPGL